MNADALRELTERLGGLVGQLASQRRRAEGVLQRPAVKEGAELRRVNHLIERQARKIDTLQSDVDRLRATFRRYTTYAGKAGKLWPRRTREELAFLDRLERIADGTRPIIVGPWTGEVGYEVLYWVPFVRWYVERYRIDPARLRILSRGGPISWYQDIAPKYVDALSFLSPDEFRQRAAARGWMKQDQVSGFDREILRRSRAALGGTRAGLLHPSLMFRLFKGFWGDRIGLNEVLAHTAHRRLEPPPPVAGLPSRYVAVRFYFRTSFPDTAANKALAARTLAALAAQTDVVLLNPGFQIDDHYDYIAEHRHRIHTIDHLLTPDRNLEVQTAVIAGADAFVGSYGGFSYLAPLLGVTSISFYSVRTFKTCHLELAEHVFERVGGGSLTVLDVADADRLTNVLPAAIDEQPRTDHAIG